MSQGLMWTCAWARWLLRPQERAKFVLSTLTHYSCTDFHLGFRWDRDGVSVHPDPGWIWVFDRGRGRPCGWWGVAAGELLGLGLGAGACR